jgi:hypothetical protein
VSVADGLETLDLDHRFDPFPAAPSSRPGTPTQRLTAGFSETVDVV